MHMLRERFADFLQHFRLPHKDGTTPFSPPKESQNMLSRQERDATTYRLFCTGILNYPTIDAYTRMGLQEPDEQSYLTTQFMRHLLTVMSEPDQENREENITNEERNVTKRLTKASGLFSDAGIKFENPRQPRALEYTAKMIAINFVRGFRHQGLNALFATELNTSLDTPPKTFRTMDDLYKPNLETQDSIDWSINIYKRDMRLTQ